MLTDAYSNTDYQPTTSVLFFLLGTGWGAYVTNDEGTCAKHSLSNATAYICRVLLCLDKDERIDQHALLLIFTSIASQILQNIFKRSNIENC